MNNLCLALTHSLKCHEFVSYDVSDIRDLMQFSAKGFQFEQLCITATIKPGFNGNPIVDLVSECMWRIVHQDSLGQVPAQDSQVLEKVPLNCQT
jgi:hypothetical protein